MNNEYIIINKTAIQKRIKECKDLNNPFNWEFVNQLNDFSSPTEAYEDAILYTLNNIIK